MAYESWIGEHGERGELAVVLEEYTPTLPGLYLYYPERRGVAATSLLHRAHATDEAEFGSAGVPINDRDRIPLPKGSVDLMVLHDVVERHRVTKIDPPA
jgi:hypothetical protein